MMSYREELTKTKAARQSPAPDNPVGPPKSKKKKPWRLYCKYAGNSRWMRGMLDWYQRGKYATESQAQEALCSIRSSGLPYDYEIRYKE